MADIQFWQADIKYPEPPEGYKFDCNRCNTKNTHGQILFKANTREVKNDLPIITEEFLIIKCSTCSAITVEYRNIEVNNNPKGENYLAIGRKVYDERLRTLIQKIYYPITVSTKDVPKIILDDYMLFHSCFSIGSSQGVAVHYRRILDKIFSEYEKKYLSNEERKLKIKERAKLISEKDLYFKAFNETIKDLKGIVSNVVHSDTDNIELSSELNIKDEDFEQLDKIILSLIKVYEIEFKDFPAIKEKSEKISKLKKGDSKS